MKVLLVQSHLGRVKSSSLIFPIGLSYIATALDTHTTKILDMNMWELPVAYEMLEKEIREFGPDVVGISIRNIDTTCKLDLFYHFKTIRPTAQLVKRINPAIKLVVGGAGFSLFAHKIMERVPEFDFGVYLEGEETISELLADPDNPDAVPGVFFRRDGEVHFTGERALPDFEKLAIPRRDSNLIDIQRYIGRMHDTIGIQAKRGCVLNCAYCSYPFLTGRELRLRSPVKVVDEIEYLIGLGVRRFTFVDNIFNVPVSHARQICEEIIRRGLQVEWGAWFEIKRTDAELMALARKAGCRHFGFSPDAATNVGLSSLNKNITEQDLKKNLEIVKTMKDIRVGYNFFFMLPGMKVIDLLKTLILYFKIPLILRGRGSVIVGWIRIEPHTDIYTSALEEKIVAENTDLLPKDEKELSKLFFIRRSYKFFDLAIVCMIKFMERIVKPTAKFLLKPSFVRKNS